MPTCTLGKGVREAEINTAVAQVPSFLGRLLCWGEVPLWQRSDESGQAVKTQLSTGFRIFFCSV